VNVPGGNDFGSYPMGTTLQKKPRFKSPADGNYRLSPASRLANAAV
jgi:hypothetical protein